MPHLSDDIQAEAYRLGFQLSGLTPAIEPPHAGVFEFWLDQGRHAGMAYLSADRAVQARRDPQQVLPGARTVLSLGMRYPDPRSLAGDSLPGTGRVASYAWGDDYHQVIPERLRSLVARIEKMIGRPLENRWYTDTGPVMERDYAQQAGLGWAGKNTCLISPRQGSYFLLSEVFIEEELPASDPIQHDLCGQCRRCIEACPTNCIEEDRTIDAGRCISYLTIENKGAIPVELRQQVGDWVFGCDICQMVCPWNLRFSDLSGGFAFQPRPQVVRPVLREELHLDAQAFNRKFKNSPVQRAKRRGYLRNVSVALGNQADSDSVLDLAAVLTGETEPLVRAHAAWALGQIGSAEAQVILQKCLGSESDSSVVQEIRQALEHSG